MRMFEKFTEQEKVWKKKRGNGERITFLMLCPGFMKEYSV